MAKGGMQISYRQALRLRELGLRLEQAQAAMAALQGQAQAIRAQFTTACEFAGIPLDKPVTLKIEAGPDKKGMVAVEWPPDKPPKAPVPAEEKDDAAS